jgi:hypothetical protein
MEESSFTLEFHPHLTEKDWASFLLAVGTAGASSKWLSSHRIELTCIKRSHLQHVGYIVFRVGQRKLCTVVGVTGEAQLQASAYAKHA